MALVGGGLGLCPTASRKPPKTGRDSLKTQTAGGQSLEITNENIFPTDFFQQTPSVFSHITHRLLDSSLKSFSPQRGLCYDCPVSGPKWLLNYSSELLTNTRQAEFHSKPVSENYD